MEERIQNSTVKGVIYDVTQDKIVVLSNRFGVSYQFEGMKGVYISIDEVRNRFRVVRVDKKNNFGQVFYDNLDSSQYVEVDEQYKLWWPIRSSSNLMSAADISFLRIPRGSNKLGISVYLGMEVSVHIVGSHAGENYYKLRILKLPKQLEGAIENEEQYYPTIATEQYYPTIATEQYYPTIATQTESSSTNLNLYTVLIILASVIALAVGLIGGEKLI